MKYNLRNDVTMYEQLCGTIHVSFIFFFIIILFLTIMYLIYYYTVIFDD